MSQLDLALESGEPSLAVRRVSLHEELSGLYQATIEVASPRPDLDAEAIVGRRAALRITRGLQHAARGARLLRGMVEVMEHVKAVSVGAGASAASTYRITLVPRLWLLTQRRNSRIFQRMSIPAIARRLLAEWSIPASFNLDEGRYPRLDYRVQYDESDYAFLSRSLEEAGISFAHTGDDAPDSAIFTSPAPELVLTDAPHLGISRGAIVYEDNPTEAAEREFVTDVHITHAVKPSVVTIRDYDFRNPGFPFIASASVDAGGRGPEAALEQAHFAPGAFLAIHEGASKDTPAADDKAAARHDMAVGQGLAARALAAERSSKNSVRFETNVVDLRPGTVFSIDHHPSGALDQRPLLALELTLEGTPAEAWTVRVRAAFAGRDAPHAPSRRTPKPKLLGVQSAVVVGPPGDEIHTDELGRVRVQFHWDREGRRDDHSSCWVRVSQGAAGGGFGMIALPRVGQEVLVGFLEGDPDQPIIMGRVYNGTSRVPYTLPAEKAVSGWRSDSTPGGGGYNEIKLDDKKGREVLSIRAERDAQTSIQHDESHVVGNDRASMVSANESALVGGNQTINVGGSRASTIGAADTVTAGSRHAVSVVGEVLGPTEHILEEDRIVLRTPGGAEIRLEGATITLSAKGGIHLEAGRGMELSVASGDLVLVGGPLVKVNP